MEQEQVRYFPEGGSYQEFIEDHLLKNEPCLFGEWATRSWGAKSRWVNKENDSPNFKYLSEEFGDAKVSVADCTRCYFSTHPKTEMTVMEFLKYWKSHDHKDANCKDDRLLYLKDWHFILEFPECSGTTYHTLPFMRSDWLNEVWAGRKDVNDDYRFVYMGPTGTWTPFHADVLRSYSWSANICGCKEWLLYRPGQEDKLRDKFGNLPFDVTSDDLEDSRKYLSAGQVAPIRVIQRAGEIIFVPSGWHHQVRNLESTISLNHNWTNSFNLVKMWQHLQHELRLVKQELDDCRAMEDWEGQCQVVLRASAGMDYWEFAQFLVMISGPRLQDYDRLVRQTPSILDPAKAKHYSEKLKRFIQDIGRSRYPKNFFGDEVFPDDLGLKSVPADDLATCLNAELPFKQLLRELPSDLRETMEFSGCHEDNQLIFRAFEVYRLSHVAEEVCQALNNTSNKL